MVAPRRAPAWRLRGAGVLACSALALTACSDDPQKAADVTPSTPTPTSTVPVPEGVEVTAPGSQLAFGDTATVAQEVDGATQVLTLTVDSVNQGALADLQGFNLDDSYKKNGNYYYARVSVTNAGETVVSDQPVPLWGVSGESTLLQAVTFTSAFKKCPTENLPAQFKPGEAFQTCLVFLSPDRGALEGVSYRPDEKFVPIEWHGAVTMQPTPSPTPSPAVSPSESATTLPGGLPGGPPSGTPSS